MKTGEAISLMRSRLTPIVGEREAQAMMRVIMDEVFHYSPVDVMLREDSELPSFAPERLDAILTRLERHEPLQYILGTARFHGHSLLVTPATLIPRPETEHLVDMAVADAGSRSDLRVLDIATGSGCIAVALARALHFPVIDAIDISDEALAVARQNAARLKVRINFAHGDALALTPPREPCYDIIVSNPPYVGNSEAADMEPNVLQYEPHLALFVPDDDLLRFYRPIIAYAAGALERGGRLYLEINRRCGAAVARLLEANGFAGIDITRDAYGNTRYATAMRPTRDW